MLRGLFPEEQKGSLKGTRGTGELRYIDQHILKESKTRRKNLSMVWIDNKKSYDMVSKAEYYIVSKCTKYPTNS